MTPELKRPVVTMPFDGFSREDYAQKLIDEYKEARVPARNVLPQSFDKADVLYWIRHEPRFGRQAVYLDDANTLSELPDAAELAQYKAEGIKIWAPPIFALLTSDGAGEIVPSQAATDARAAGLDIITWTLERSGILADGNNGFTTRASMRPSRAKATPCGYSTRWRARCRYSGVLRLAGNYHLLRQLHGPLSADGAQGGPRRRLRPDAC